MKKDSVAFSQKNVFGNIIALATTFQKRLDEQYAKYGISGYQHIVITVVCRNPGLPQLELLNWLSLNPSSITRNVTAAIKLGYIERKRMEADKRNWLLYPTEKAMAIYEEIVRIYDDMMEEMLAPLTGEEQEVLQVMLTKIREGILKEK